MVQSVKSFTATSTAAVTEISSGETSMISSSVADSALPAEARRTATLIDGGTLQGEGFPLMTRPFPRRSPRSGATSVTAATQTFTLTVS